MFDLTIINGKIIDGTGNPMFSGNIGINADTICYIGNDVPQGKKTIDAEGHFVTPGFVDIHTHSDYTILQCP